ncbi:dephospho-CoA kinase domain-containing protein [Ditylenchus destructor]|uniref:Dephospho-CoA kinase domain-containing protein n=1 Tax=Ditylenchus destructor TaxID=166010 RepID=A0AAD4NFS6_9BILA|nr:dephospho-CoA kinase domain-containing protein [Ditylenchus destructor]
MLLVGLTGSIGSGKSTVSKFLREEGNIVIVDADELAKTVVEPGRSAYTQLRREFGDEYFDDDSDGRLKRDRLAALVFHDQEKRHKLNSIVHPAVAKEIVIQIVKNALSFENILILDVPLLFESGMDRYVQRTIVVSCDEETQIERIMGRDGMSDSDARARIETQMSTAEKIRRATYVVDNNGSLEETRIQVKKIIADLKSSRQPFIIRKNCAPTFDMLKY